MYCEILPASCPPGNSVDHAISSVYRRIDNAVAQKADFLSHAALGKKPRLPYDPCKWASCSLFRDKRKIVNICAGLPKPREYANYVAELDIPKDVGRWIENSKGHIDLWMYGTFDPVTAVVKVEAVDDIQ